MGSNLKFSGSHDLAEIERILGIGGKEGTAGHAPFTLRFEREACMPHSGRMLNGRIRLGRWTLLFPTSGAGSACTGKERGCPLEACPDPDRLEKLIDHITFRLSGNR